MIFSYLEEERPPPPASDIMATGVSVAERRVGRVDIDRLGERERGGFVSCFNGFNDCQFCFAKISVTHSEIQLNEWAIKFHRLIS